MFRWFPGYALPMHCRISTVVWCSLVTAMATSAAAQGGRGALPAGDVPERMDYLTFAQGAVPIRIEGTGAQRGADFEAAVRITDGDPTAFTVADRARVRYGRRVRLSIAGTHDIRPFGRPECGRDSEPDRHICTSCRSPRFGHERKRWVHPARISDAANPSCSRLGDRTDHGGKATGPVDQAAPRGGHQHTASDVVPGVQRDHRQRHAGDAATVDEFRRCLENAGQSRATDPEWRGRVRLLRLCGRLERNRHRQHPSRNGSRSQRQDAKRFHPERRGRRGAARRSLDQQRPVPPLHARRRPTGQPVRMWNSCAADAWMRLDHSQHHVRF